MVYSWLTNSMKIYLKFESHMDVELRYPKPGVNIPSQVTRSTHIENR